MRPWALLVWKENRGWIIYQRFWLYHSAQAVAADFEQHLTNVVHRKALKRMVFK